MLPDYFERQPILIVAAHPDDETIGLAAQFAVLRNTYLIHVTDGAPLSTPNRAQYASIRRQELRAAMDLAGVKPARCLELGAADQQSSFILVHLTHLLLGRLAEIVPQAVFTHPYEGGHPDHDACAFIVQAAVGAIPPARRPLRVEFTSYHNAAPLSPAAKIHTGEFLPGPPVTNIPLPPPAQQLKQRMFECFKSQQHILQDFPIVGESFRLAPWYDFSVPPHAGRLYYDDKPWGVGGGAEWRRLAGDAAQELRARELRLGHPM